MSMHFLLLPLLHAPRLFGRVLCGRVSAGDTRSADYSLSAAARKTGECPQANSPGAVAGDYPTKDQHA